MAVQLSMFPEDEVAPAPEEAETPPRLHSRSTLAEALDAFDQAMLLKGFTSNTVTAFQTDLRILTKFIPPSRPIGAISTKDLEDFLAYLLRDRGRPCNPKSYARRITTLKVFFGWLAEIGARSSDPAAALVHHPVATPLPHILNQEEIDQLLATAHQAVVREKKPDPRPLLLLQLLLQTGMKKSECMTLHLSHLNLTDPDGPTAQIRYTQARQKHKERSLRLKPEIVPILRAYREHYRPAEFLFECTARNLEYILRDLAEEAGVAGGVSFESLRWTAALRDYQAGTAEDALRRKLGLSKLRWREFAEKLKRMAEPPL